MLDADREAYVAAYYELRKEKGVTPEKAESTMKDPLFYAAMMVKKGRGDGMVAGALCTTGETLRPGLQIIKWQRVFRSFRAALLWKCRTKPMATTD